MMAGPAAIIAKAAVTLLTDEKARKGVGWLLVAIFSPVIVFTALLCAIGIGGADHNNLAVEACFYGMTDTASAPLEFQNHISEMQDAFHMLDTAIANANGASGGLDPTQVKAIFFALCFGEDAPNRREARQFVECFCTTREETTTVERVDGEGNILLEEETVTVTLPYSLDLVYTNLASYLGKEITQADRDNAAHIYTMVAGNVLGETITGGGYTGSVDHGSSHSVEIDTSGFRDPDTKNAEDLVAYAIQAWQRGWGYVWGSALCSLTICVEIRSKTRQFS